jgi:hypothetical protein
MHQGTKSRGVGHRQCSGRELLAVAVYHTTNYRRTSDEQATAPEDGIILQQNQALPSYRHALQQTRSKCSRRRPVGRGYHPAQLKTEPNSLKTAIDCRNSPLPLFPLSDRSSDSQQPAASSQQPTNNRRTTDEQQTAPEDGK